MVADRTARKKSILSMRFPVIANTPQLGLVIHQRQKNKKRKISSFNEKPNMKTLDNTTVTVIDSKRTNL